MKRIAIVLAALVLGLCAPVAATAQLAPTNVPPALTTPDEQADPTPFDEDTGLSTLQLVLIFGGAILVIGVIAWVILRDARTAAPEAGRGHARAGGSVAAAGPASGGGSAKAKSAREREREKRRKRERTKAQRNQRKKNRPR